MSKTLSCDKQGLVLKCAPKKADCKEVYVYTLVRVRVRLRSIWYSTQQYRTPANTWTWQADISRKMINPDAVILKYLEVSVEHTVPKKLISQRKKSRLGQQSYLLSGAPVLCAQGILTGIHAAVWYRCRREFTAYQDRVSKQTVRTFPSRSVFYKK